jgi:hypothetical protein
VAIKKEFNDIESKKDWEILRKRIFAPVSAKHIIMHLLDNCDLRCYLCLDICQILDVDSILVVAAVSTDCST